MIHKIKFSRRPEYLPTLSQGLIDIIAKRDYPLPEVITAIPLSKQRQRLRGFNQAGEIAKSISKQIGIKNLELIKRVKECPPQSVLKRKERMANVKNAFLYHSEISYQHVAIVDDVITTGSTVNEAAKLLRKKGFMNIEVWALAKTPEY